MCINVWDALWQKRAVLGQEGAVQCWACELSELSKSGRQPEILAAASGYRKTWCPGGLCQTLHPE